jgi:hypothetical protein
MAVIKRKKTNEYAQIHNGVLQDNRLSYSSIGLASYLMSLPEDWVIVKEQVYNHSDIDGRRTVDRAFKELSKYGYLISGYGYGPKKVKNGKTKTVKQYEYMISDIPFTAEEIRDFYLELFSKWKSVILEDNNFSTVHSVQYTENSTKRTTTKKDFTKKDFTKIEEEEKTIVSEIIDIDLIANEKIKEYGITNQTTINAIKQALPLCKSKQKESIINYVIQVVEQKISRLGKEERKSYNSKKGNKKPIRREDVTDEQVAVLKGEVVPESNMTDEEAAEFRKQLEKDLLVFKKDKKAI